MNATNELTARARSQAALVPRPELGAEEEGHGRGVLQDTGEGGRGADDTDTFDDAELIEFSSQSASLALGPRVRSETPV